MSEMITGAGQLDALAARLVSIDMRAELVAALHAVASGPITRTATSNSRTRLPKRGGLNERVSGETVVVEDRSTTFQAGVRIGTTTSDSRSTNQGRVRHPVFGHRDRWSEEPIPNATGWFDDAVRSGQDDVGAAIAGVLAATALRVTGA